MINLFVYILIVAISMLAIIRILTPTYIINRL